MSDTSPGSALPLRDTPLVYGRITRILHWTIAALVVWQFVSMGLKLTLGRTPVVSFFVGTHQKVGAVLFVLIAARIVWALANRRHRPHHGDGVLGMGARLGHFSLYAVMFLVPGLALLRAYGSDRVFAPFGFEIFPAQQPAIGWMVGLGNALHGNLAWVLLALIAGHVIMVALHESMWRDGTLARMAGRLRG